MKKFKFLYAILLAFCILMPQNSKSQNKTSTAKNPVATFTWEDALCSNNGRYDPRKYTANQLQNTLDIWMHFGIALSTDATVFSAKQIPKLSMADLTKEYENRKQYFDTLQIVDTPFWNKIKELRIDELEEEYALKKITIQAYTDVSVLKSNQFSKLCPPDVLQALTSGNDNELLSFWKIFVEKECTTNGSPKDCENRFYYSNVNSPNKVMEARAFIITFGWWNPVNRKLREARDSDSLNSKMEKEFNQLFTRVKTECEEP